jgi:cell division protein FtsI (penicillin-binding protein 3)
VVERGTAKAAQIPGYTIAGKTGTAAKLVNGRYQKSDYNASFVGFIPSRKPALTILVVIDSPHGSGYTGGAVSAPVFKRIAEASMTYLGIPPTIDPPPPVIVTTHEPNQQGGAVRPTVLNLGPTARPAFTDNGLMPDLRNLSARDALHYLSRLGMAARMSGDGFVISQKPEPGTVLVRGDTCELKLGRRPVTIASAGAGGEPQ